MNRPSFRFAIRLAAAAVVTAAARTPNLVVILTDNQGAWTLGCYGNPDIRTPRIDRLASEGIRFTRAMACNPVCSPTRASLLTGLMPSQHGVHSYLGGERPNAQMGPDAYNTIAEFVSLPEILRGAGYACGLVGKWHLGANLTPQEGFVEWVTMPAGHTTEFYDAQVIEDDQVRRESGYLTDFWTRRAVRFIERHHDRPFFLWLAFNGPYGLGRLLKNPARNRHAAWYESQALMSFPRDAPHPWLHNNREYLNDETAIRRVAAETSGIDDGVGEVLDAIERAGLSGDTLVVYTADQGWMGGQNGLWGMGDHTRPIGAHELMMHVPLLFRQPGSIPAGRTCDLLVGTCDVLPTVLGHLGLRHPAPARLPGRDCSAVLRGAAPLWTNEVFYEMETCRAIRTDEWKYVARFPDGPFELYDMRRDPRERFNLYGQPAHAGIQRELAGRLAEFFAAIADPRYDLWNGGRSKAGRLTEPAPSSAPATSSPPAAARP